MDVIYVILTVFAGLALLYILWCLAEPFFLDMDKATLKKSPRKDPDSNNIVVKKQPMTSKDNGLTPDLKFFFFSDTHAEWCPVNAKRICSAIRDSHKASALDGVIFGGDIITYPRNAARGFRYINEVSSCCKELGIPFYGITGNHDVNITDFAAKAGFTLIDNLALPLTSKTSGKKAFLAGVPDSGTRKLAWPEMPSCEGGDPVILIAHDPDTLIHIAPEKRPDFMLSGHLHGGQMKFPFKIEFRVLRKKDKLPNMGAVQGVFDISGTTVFISRGLGCGIMPFRFLSMPEATVVGICL
ncbi:MAG: metallophosphoesterase [Clostridiales bacterium]|nr:metallophosphoesterase [Clostridiales bacterium]